MTDTIISTAYLPSEKEYYQLLEKFPAFVQAKVSKNAENDGALISEEFPGNGYYPLRTKVEDSKSKIYYAVYNGTLIAHRSYLLDAGLRVAFNLLYKSNSCVVKTLKTETRTSLIYDRASKTKREVTSTAPIITFAGKPCIWLNKEACENGSSMMMKCLYLNLEELAQPFSQDGNFNDYIEAEKLREQCEMSLRRGISKRETNLLIGMQLNKNDGYDRTTPVSKRVLLKQNILGLGRKLSKAEDKDKSL